MMVETERRSLPNSVDDFLSLQNMTLIDDSVSEVFAMMLGYAVALTESLPPSGDPDGQPERTAIVGFMGAMRGTCSIRLTRQAAIAVASAMLCGLSFEENSDSIDDAVGELCNMLAGGWKGRIPRLDSRCLLSPPAVISGSDYRVHIRVTSVAFTRTYRFEQHALQVTMVRDEQSGF